MREMISKRKHYTEQGSKVAQATLVESKFEKIGKPQVDAWSGQKILDSYLLWNLFRN